MCGVGQWEDLLPSIAVFVGEGIPFFVSEPDLWTANRSFQVLATQRCDKLYPVTLNPFRSPLSCVSTSQQWGLTVPALPNAFLLGCGVDEQPAGDDTAATAGAHDSDDDDDDDEEDADDDGVVGGDEDVDDDDDGEHGGDDDELEEKAGTS